MVTYLRYGGIFSTASKALRNVYLREDMDFGPLPGPSDQKDMDFGPFTGSF